MFHLHLIYNSLPTNEFLFHSWMQAVWPTKNSLASNQVCCVLCVCIDLLFILLTVATLGLFINIIQQRRFHFNTCTSVLKLAKDTNPELSLSACRCCSLCTMIGVALFSVVEEERGYIYITCFCCLYIDMYVCLLHFFLVSPSPS